MTESTIFTIAFILYIGSAFFYLAYLYSKRENLAKTGSAIALFGLLLHTLALILRTVESGHAPFTNMYESLSFLAWATVFAYLVIEWKYKVRKPGAYLLLIVVALMALASSPLMPKNATPLVPALQSYWLWLHVSVTLLGEAFFAIAFITSLMYLRAEAREKKGQAPKTGLTAERLDSISYRAISVGFPLFTLGGLVLGKPGDQAPDLLRVPAPVGAPGLIGPDHAEDESAQGEKREPHGNGAIADGVQTFCGEGRFQRLALLFPGLGP